MWNACKRWWATLMSGRQHQQTWVRDRLVERPLRVEIDANRTLLIRFGTIEDAAAIAAVERAAYQGTPPWDLSAIQEDLAKNHRGLYLVGEWIERSTAKAACQETRQEDLQSNPHLPIRHIVGFIGTRFNDGDDVHITNLSVVPDDRFLGIGRMLIEQVVLYARQAAKDAITLEVRASNLPALNLYRKIGFEQVGRKVGYYSPNNEDALEMRYPIPAEHSASLASAAYSFTRLPADPALAPTIAALVEEAYTVASNWTTAGFAEDLVAPQSVYYGVYHEETLIGFMGFQLVLDEGTLTNVAIHPDEQGAGLATRLWQMAQYDLATKGIKTVFLEVRAHNEPAKRFYEKVGFTKFHIRSHYYQNPVEDAWEYTYVRKEPETDGQTISD